MIPQFTILLPVMRPPLLLPFAIQSVLAQDVKSFELFIISDGAPKETVECALDFAAKDPRIKVFPFSKGASCGEAHRHTALENAKGRYVAHIADDDLWFPNHLEEMEKLLKEVDFGQVLHVYANYDESFLMLASDLENPNLRQRILTEEYNTLGDTVTGYRLDAYRALSEGWAPGANRVNPDLKMWRKFLCRQDFSFGTRMAVTALILATETRHHLSLEERARETGKWYDRLQLSTERDVIVREAWRSLVAQTLRLDEHCRSLTTQINALAGAMKVRVGNRLLIGTPIDFTERGTSFLYTDSGWSAQEGGHRWTDGEVALLRVRLVSPSTEEVRERWLMRLRAMAFDGSQRVVIRVDGQISTELMIDGGWQDYSIVVRPCAVSTETEIKFQLPDAHSPSSVGASDDHRALGIAVSEMIFLPVPEPGN